MTLPASPLDPLIGILSSGPGAHRPSDWRLFWSSWETSHIGVRDCHRAGVHTPLTLGRGFGLDYLLQWPDGRISTGAAERMALADPERFLALASQAAYEDPDGGNFSGPTEIPAIPLHSEDLEGRIRSGESDLFASLLTVAADAASTWGFSTWSGSASAGLSERAVMTSRGLLASVRATHAAYGFWYEGRAGDGHSSRVRIPPAEAEERLTRACDYVRRLGSPETSFAPGTMPVLLHPGVVESLLATYVLANLAGDRIYHGQSAFRIDQFGADGRVFADSLALRLEPCEPMDAGSFRFTAEGVPARPVAYIESGRLVHPILDLKYARRFGRDPVPGPLSAESLRLTGPPPIEESEAYARIERGVLVLSLLGLHTQDPTRGDFSISAPQTLAIRSRTLGGGVKAILTGNVFDVLRDPRLALVSFPGFRTPGLLFEGSVGIDGSG